MMLFLENILVEMDTRARQIVRDQIAQFSCMANVFECSLVK